jgi:hypothetical protein
MIGMISWPDGSRAVLPNESSLTALMTAIAHELERHEQVATAPVPPTTTRATLPPITPEAKTWAAGAPRPRKDLMPLEGKGDLALHYIEGRLPEQQRAAYVEKVTALLEGIARHYGIKIQNSAVSEQNLNVMSFTVTSPEQAVPLTRKLQDKGFQVVNVHNGFVVGWDVSKAAGSLWQKLEEITTEIGATPARPVRRGGAEASPAA